MTPVSASHLLLPLGSLEWSMPLGYGQTCYYIYFIKCMMRLSGEQHGLMYKGAIGTKNQMRDFVIKKKNPFDEL